jgi:hypothetical protein
VGRGLADDPNTTAEFLDNVLDGERLEAFERVCIESDMHLADVAGCHRILAEMLREPDSVETFEPSSGRTALEAARRAVRGPAVEPSGDRRSRRPATVAVAPQPSRRRAPLAAWLSAAAALVLLVAVGGGLIWTLTRRRSDRPRQVAAVEAAPAVAKNAPPAPPPEMEQAAATKAPPAPARAEPDPARESPPPAAATDRKEETAPRMAVVEASPAVSPPPAVEQATAPASPPSPPPPPARSVPFGEAMAIGGGTEPLPDGGGGPPAAAGDAVAQPAAIADVDERVATLVEGAVLVRVAGDGGGWRSVKASGPLGDEPDRFDLLAPAGVYPLVTVAGVAIRLHPGTRVVVSRVADAALSLVVAHGRVVIEGTGDVSWPAVSAGGLRGGLGLADRQAAGIEVASDVPAGGGPIDAVPPRAAVFSGASARAWRQAAADGAERPLIGIPGEALIPADTALRWDGRDPATARLEPCPAPGWMREVAPADRTWHRAGRDLAAAVASVPADAALETLRRRSSAGLPEDRAAAAATLAFLGEPAGLVDLLCDAPPRGLGETQWSAVEAMTVPVVLARGGPEAESLLAAFRERAPGGAAVAALARGPGDEDLAKDGGAELVAGLDDANLVVRRYAILRLREIVPRDARHGDDYRADRAAAERGESVKWWRTLAERGGVRRGAGQANAPPAGRGGE